MNCKNKIYPSLLLSMQYYHSSPGSGRSGGGDSCIIIGTKGVCNKRSFSDRAVIMGSPA